MAEAPDVRSGGQAGTHVERGRAPRSQGAKSGEYVIGMSTIARKPLEAPWNPKVIDVVGGVP